MNQPLQRPVVVVTGGTSGIGLAIVRELAANHLVYTVGRSAPALATLEQYEHVESVSLDLLDTEAVQKFVSPGPTDTPMNRLSREREGDFAAINPLAYSTSESVKAAVRLVVNATEDTQITDVVVRPRCDSARR